jgi:hypothetical protein
MTIDAFRRLTAFPGVPDAVASLLSRFEANVNLFAESVQAAAVVRWAFDDAIVTFADTPYLAAVGQCVLVDTTDGPVTIKVPEPAPQNTGRRILIREVAGGNGITLQTVAGLIDGVASVGVRAPGLYLVSGGAQYGWRTFPHGPADEATRRITSSDSPYTALATEAVIFCDTDGGAITVNLPAGVEGRFYKIVNCGTIASGNVLTIDGNGAETVNGAATQLVHAGESMDLHFNATEGWWA